MKSKAPSEKIAELGRKLFILKQRRDELAEELSDVEKQIKKIAEEDLARLMTDAEVEKTTLKGFGTIYLSDVFYASVIKENRPALYKWLKENGHDALVQEFVFPQTLTSFAKEMTGKGLPLPDTIKVTVIPTARTRSSAD